MGALQQLLKSGAFWGCLAACGLGLTVGQQRGAV